MKRIITADYTAVSEVVQQSDEQLKKWKISDGERSKSILALEEMLVKVVDASSPNDKIAVSLNKSYRKVAFKISGRGEQITIPMENADLNVVGEEYGPDAEEVIRNIILSHSQDRLSLKYNRGINHIDIIVHRNDKAAIYDTLIALVLALLTATVIRMTLPQEVVTTITNYLFTPLFNLFMRAVMMVLAPMIFFSLVSCIANITDLSSLGRTSAKIMCSYFGTTVIAILTSIGMYYMLQPAANSSIMLPTDSMDSELVETSLLQTIVNIVPDNFFGAFAANDILQVLFLAIFAGIAVGATGQYSNSLRQGTEAINALTQTILKYIVKVMPIAVFGAVGSMACTLDFSAFAVLFKYAITIFLTYIVMQMVYMLYIFIFGRINPLVFIKRFLRVQLAALSTGSSCATMPVTMQVCHELGISPKVYNFSIPLGTTINMDGACITFAISGLFLADLYGVAIDPGTMFSFILTVVLLSMATPPVPSAGIACVMIVLNCLHVPLEAVTILLGIMPFFDISGTVNNVVSDGAVTLVVAKSEGLLDVEKYKKC